LTPVTRTHGLDLYDRVVRIPLLARVPGWPSVHVSGLASLIDVMPTILALTLTPAPARLDGIDLAPVAHAVTPAARMLFSDTWRFQPNERLELDLAAAFDGRRKYVLDRTAGALYVGAQQPAETELHLVGNAPVDALSAAVFDYVEESGNLPLVD
jgi:arylsulfatase A-like enzyme